MGTLKILNPDLNTSTASFLFTRCFTKVNDRIFVEANAINAYALVEGMGFDQDPYKNLYVLIRNKSTKAWTELERLGGEMKEINDEYSLCVFSLEVHKLEVQKILEGRFTELSKESKEAILFDLSEWLHEGGKRRRANAWRWLHPLDKDREELAEALGVPKSLIKEVRHRPRMEDEILRIGPD